VFGKLITYRFVSLGVLFLLSCLGLSAAPWDKRICAPDSQYKEVFKSNAASLRWSLFALSELTKAGKIDENLLTTLTKSSVISLANTLSLRARYLGPCNFELKDYEREIQDNEEFANLMLDVTSSERFPVADIIKSKYPSLIPWRDPQTAIAGKEVPVHGAVQKTLDSVRREVERASNPYFIAASQLLGEDRSFDEREIQAVQTIEVNAENPLHNLSLEKALALVQNQDSVSVLKSLRWYYRKPAKPAEGVPSTVQK